MRQRAPMHNVQAALRKGNLKGDRNEHVKDTSFFQHMARDIRFDCLHADRRHRARCAAGGEVPSVTVSYADLDLSNPAGAHTLYQRIKAAASTVCAPLESKELKRNRLWRDCYEQAVSNAVATINRPTLTALHQAGRTGRG